MPLDDLASRYDAIRARFAPGEALRLDEHYRLAHLPLIAPSHPDAITSAPGRDYRCGRYSTARRSLVVPIDWGAIAGHPLLAAFGNASFTAKIDWPLIERRRDRLHVTVCAAGATPRPLPPPFRMRVGGPLVGERNRGRIYLACYPEQSAAGDPLAALRAQCGCGEGGLYLLGLFNLLDHLDAGETWALSRLLTRFEAETVATVTVERLALLTTHDDLALDARFSPLPLGQRRGAGA